MFLASRTVGSAIVFALLTTGMPGQSPTFLAADSDPRQPALIYANDVKRMQQVLQDRGHYRGKIDGVIGLHTRAGIRDFQKAEELPVTGEIDLQTGKKLGVTVQDIVENRQDIGPQKTKPWAGAKSTKAPRRKRNPSPKVVPSQANADDRQENREDRQHAKIEK